MESDGISATPHARRSKAWIYYAILTVLALAGIPAAGWGGLLAAILCGLYSTYLFRGGRIVVWFW
ncbi:hypothetical protein ABZS29_21385 [Kribbella sp. NPDC005582]|uniref:hypothetical protein n=1 Tax=Kribbella sp. NPDC005582 TaxID=3156893 RepID=UPI0033B1454F